MTTKTTKLKAKTVKLLRKIQAQILEEPKRLNMHDFGTAVSTDGPYFEDGEYPVCQTKACIGGWAILLKKPKVWKDILTKANDDGYGAIEDQIDPEEKAVELLGITVEQGKNLFYFKHWSGETGFGWPEKFAKAYDKAKTAKQRAKVTVARIEHFIATEGAE